MNQFMITSSNLPVNNEIGHSSVVSRFTDLAKQHNSGHYRTRSYSLEHKRYQEADKLADEKGYNPTRRLLLKKLVSISNADCEVFHGKESLAKLATISVKTLQRCFNDFVRDGAIVTERRGNGWQDRQTNKTTLLFLKHVLPVVEVKMTNDINNPVIQDPDLKKTVLRSIPEKFEKRPTRLPDKPSSPHAVFSIFTNLGLSLNDSAGLFNISKRLKLGAEHVLLASERFIAYQAKMAVTKPSGVLRRMLEGIAGEIRTTKIRESEANWEKQKQAEIQKAREAEPAPISRAEIRKQAIAQVREVVKAKGITDHNVIEALLRNYEDKLMGASHVRH